jgi:hypothetical protein
VHDPRAMPRQRLARALDQTAIEAAGCNFARQSLWQWRRARRLFAQQGERRVQRSGTGGR